MNIFLEIFISYNLLYTDKNKQQKKKVFVGVGLEPP